MNKTGVWQFYKMHALKLSSSSEVRTSMIPYILKLNKTHTRVCSVFGSTHYRPFVCGLSSLQPEFIKK